MDTDLQTVEKTTTTNDNRNNNKNARNPRFNR